jgi:hypothetical protein
MLVCTKSDEVVKCRVVNGIFRDVEAKSFDVSPLTFFLKRERIDMNETIGEFKTDLGLCANTVLTESEFSVDVPSQMFDHLKATVCLPLNFCFYVYSSNYIQITVHFKLLEKRYA